MRPDLNDHLNHFVEFQSSEEVRVAVDILLELGTCFAVIGGEFQVRTTDRGAKALEDGFL